MKFYWQFGRFDVSLTISKVWQRWLRLPRRLRPSRHEEGEEYGLVVSGLTLTYEDASADTYRQCAECDSVGELAECGMGDEYLTRCSACESIEPSIRYINKREFDNAVS
jgi:hypothetical protein